MLFLFGFFFNLQTRIFRIWHSIRSWKITECLLKLHYSRSCMLLSKVILLTKAMCWASQSALLSMSNKVWHPSSSLSSASQPLRFSRYLITCTCLNLLIHLISFSSYRIGFKHKFFLSYSYRRLILSDLILRYLQSLANLSPKPHDRTHNLGFFFPQDLWGK